MTTNAIAISRRIAAAGVDKQAAEAIAEEIVTHADESHATKADVFNLKAELKTNIANLRSELKSDIARGETKHNVVVIALVLGMLVVLLADNLA